MYEYYSKHDEINVSTHSLLICSFCHMNQATIKSPTVKNINKALLLQFTVGTIPFFVITMVGYWAYGNLVYPYLIINLSGPKWAITFAEVAALLQAIIVFHVSISSYKLTLFPATSG